MNLFPLVAIICLFLTTFSNGQSDFMIDYSENKWELRVLDKLSFNKSSSFYRSFNLAHLEEFGKTKLYVEYYVTDLNKINKVDKSVDFRSHIPNLDIHYFIDPVDGSPQCNFSVYFSHYHGGYISNETEIKDKSSDPFLNELRMMCQKDVPVCINVRDKTDGAVSMQGVGKFNEPIEAPQCLYDFYTVATARSEYELLRYCAKGYFYQGHDLDHPAARFMREDWVLYLMNGRVLCNVTKANRDSAEANRELVQMGYSVAMVQRNNMGETNDKCYIEAILSQYDDNADSGVFMLAGIVGSAMLDNKQNKLWKIDVDDDGNLKLDDTYKPCFEDYWSKLRRKDGSYVFKLRVGHYCTPGKEYELIDFDLSFNPELLPKDGVHEDQGVEIYLDSQVLRLPTNKLICADKEEHCNRQEMERRLGIKPGSSSAAQLRSLDLSGGNPEIGDAALHLFKSMIGINASAILDNATTLADDTHNSTANGDSSILSALNGTDGDGLNGTNKEIK